MTGQLLTRFFLAMVTALWGFVWLAELLSGQQSAVQPASPLDRELLRDLEPPRNVPGRQVPPGQAGEDIGKGPEESLAEVYNKMLLVAERLRAGDSGEKTQAIQEEIVERLRRWIAEQQKRQSASAQQAPADVARSAAASAHQQLAATPMPADPANPTAGLTTDNRRRQEGTGPADGADARRAARVWGHLPARIREQLQSMGAEDFLPAYRELIEAYYRRLSEEDAHPIP